MLRLIFRAGTDFNLFVSILLIMKIGETLISIILANIIDQDTEIIVNAANSSLMGGGGVDGAIHRAGGPRILEECKKIRREKWKAGLPPGEAVITNGGRLKSKYVIHTVGPVWKGGGSGEDRILRNCYLNSLKLAESKNAHSISFPSISTGAYGYPISNAGEIAFSSLINYFSESGSGMKEVRFVLFSPHDLEIYRETAKRHFE